MYDNIRKENDWQSDVVACANENKRRIVDFEQKLEQWKMNTMVAQTKMARDNGVPMPARPPIPMEQYLVRSEFDTYWDNLHHDGIKVDPKPYFHNRPLATIPDSVFDLNPPNPNTPKANTGKPVGDKDPVTGKGWFQFVLGSVKSDGSAYKRGDVWNDPATDIDYELREAARESVFNLGVHPFRWAALGIAKPSPVFA